MADKPKEKTKENRGGPRPKVRPDDRRGWNARGGSEPYFEGFQPTDEHRELIKTYGVILTQPHLATMLGISQSTMIRHYAAEIAISQARATATIGSKLYAAAVAGEPWAIRYYLNTIGKFARRVEVSGPDGAPLMPPDVDLSKCSDDQLDIIERAVRILAGIDQGEPDGDARPDQGGTGGEEA
jgi:hypothetical protein